MQQPGGWHRSVDLKLERYSHRLYDNIILYCTATTQYEAIINFNIALKYDPKNITILDMKAFSLLKSKKYKECIKTCEEILKIQ